MPSAWVLAGSGAGIELLGLVLVGRAYQRWALRRRVADTPTSRVRSAAMGPVELKGRALPGEPPALAPFTGQPCAWWRVTVVEERGNGSNGEWVEIHADASTAAFQLEDAGARLTVDPVGAEVRAPMVFEFTSREAGSFRLLAADPPLLAPQGLAWAAGGTQGARRRLREWRFDPQQPLYALGVLRPRRGADGADLGPRLGSGERGEPFLLAADAEDELLRDLAWSALAWASGALLALGLGAWLLRSGWH